MKTKILILVFFHAAFIALLPYFYLAGLPYWVIASMAIYVYWRRSDS